MLIVEAGFHQGSTHAQLEAGGYSDGLDSGLLSVFSNFYDDSNAIYISQHCESSGIWIIVKLLTMYRLALITTDIDVDESSLDSNLVLLIQVTGANTPDQPDPASVLWTTVFTNELDARYIPEVWYYDFTGYYAINLSPTRLAHNVGVYVGCPNEAVYDELRVTISTLDIIAYGEYE